MPYRGKSSNPNFLTLPNLEEHPSTKGDTILYQYQRKLKKRLPNNGAILNLFPNYEFGASQTLDLVYSKPGDSGGLFYFLGTLKGTAEWTNPTNFYQLRIEYSTLETTELGLPYEVVDRNLSYVAFGINDAEPPEIFVQFILPINSHFVCKGYLIRGHDGSNNYLRSWKLQGSNDGFHWTDLHNQNNFQSITRNSWHYFNVFMGFSCTTIRIVMTSPNSSGENYLFLGEVELYGELTTSLNIDLPQAN